MSQRPTDDELNAWDSALWDPENALDNVDGQRLIAEVRKLRIQDRYGTLADPTGEKTKAELESLRKRCTALQTRADKLEEEIDGYVETLRQARIALGMSGDHDEDR